MKILKKEDIIKGSPLIQGYCLVGSYSEQPTKNGSTYLNGVLHADGEVPFKVWRGSAFEQIKQGGYENEVCEIRGKRNEWNGQVSVIVEGISPPLTEEQLSELGLSKSSFMCCRYDTVRLLKNLYDGVKKLVSEEAYDVFEYVMNKLPVERFITEFAAVYHHDNCVGGLLAHTWKVVKLASVLKLYPELYDRVDTDVLFVGAALHDIGKVVEYSNGTMSEMGKLLDHSTHGIIMLHLAQEYIEEQKGRDFYKRLLSVVAQHHGEYGARPRTLEAFLVHKFDMLDSELTSLNETVLQSDGSQVVCGDYKLS